MIARFLIWLLRRMGHYQVFVPEQVIHIQVSALKACRILEAESDRPGMGESKRHRAYAALIKLYPKARRKDIALALELAVREM